MVSSMRSGSLAGFVALAVCACAPTKPSPGGAGGNGGSAGTGGGDAGPAFPTYYKDIKVIVDAKCTSCHKTGGVAPMSLESAANVQAFSNAVRHAVVERHMPPWMASPGCNEYIDDRSLSSEQIQTIARWVEQGAVLGDPSETPPPLPVPKSDMSRVDLRLQIPEPYTPDLQPDDHRCFVFDWPLDTTQAITGIGVTPGVVKEVHHSIAYLVAPSGVAAAHQRDDADPGPGYWCPGGVTGGWITSWEPGGHGFDFPHGTGIPVQPGSAIILQVHYNTAYTAPVPDQTSVEFALTSEPSVAARTLTWLNNWWTFGGMPIPANDPDVVHAFQAMPPMGGARAIQIHWADIHMHTLGKAGELSVRHADGTSECLLRVDQYDFAHQETFLLRNPVELRQGDQLRVECRWDNTIDKQRIVDGVRQEPKNVNWGEGTADEMCLGNFLISSAD